MLKQIINVARASLSEKQFKELMELVTTDIYVNNISMGKRTSLEYAVQVLERTYRILRRYRVA